MDGPTADDLERGGKFVLRIAGESDSPGVVEDQSGTIRWRHETQPKRSAYSWANLIRKPDFVLVSPEGQEMLRIRRVSRHPPAFEVLEQGQPVARILRRSILRNKYLLELKDGQAWTFRMPLYTLRCRGESTGGRRFWVFIGPSRRQWNLLFQPGGETVELLACLAFIHRERWCYA